MEYLEPEEVIMQRTKRWEKAFAALSDFERWQYDCGGKMRAAAGGFQHYQITVNPPDSDLLLEDKDFQAHAGRQAMPLDQIILVPERASVETAKGDWIVGHNLQVSMRVVFFTHPAAPTAIGCLVNGKPKILPVDNDKESVADWLDNIRNRNELAGLEIPAALKTAFKKSIKLAAKTTSRAPSLLPQPTFYEARTGATAISDGRDLCDWRGIDGMIAMLHAPKNSIMQTRFEPCALLLSWWGSPSGAQLETLQAELQNLEFDALVTYFVCLSWAIEEYQVSTSIDSLIEAIGRGTDARRSTKARAVWRAKVWRWLCVFDSLAVIGARPGVWKELPDGNGKRALIDADKLYSRDALLKIIGTRDTEQGTFDNSAPPKEVSFVAGAWVNQWRGNREILSNFGNVRAIASIPRGKPSGAWAACIGFALDQKWREQAAKTPVIELKKDERKIVTQRFKPFTRRVLLAQLWRSDDDVLKILESVNPERAREYWRTAISLLQKQGIIGFYKEIKPLPAEREGWQKKWLDQPLDIRPTGDNWANAITISKSATAARKRGRKKIGAKAVLTTE
jgi:hypothetical protein